MKEINNIVGDIFVIFISYVFFCILMNFILRSIFKNIYKIKLPMESKWSGKVNPIYKLVRSNFNDGYDLYKYSLKYATSDGLDSLSWFIIPFPIDILVYRYHLEGNNFYLTPEFAETTKESLEDIYEFRYLKAKEEVDRKKKEQNKKNEFINNLNQTFNENFE